MMADKKDTQPCQCAAQAIKQGYLTLDPDCQANACKDLRKGKDG